MGKTELFIGQLMIFVAGVGLTLYGWITHNSEAAAFGIPLAVGAAAAFGIQRPKDI